ncbi:MAG: hypothetical protein KGM47_00695, partial [Acidobacteriota bacterium]|nr:hypothetical protein [Acidobacteriota bacterium]
EMLSASGARPLGIEAAQLIALTQWAKSKYSPASIRLETTGIRSQVISLAAASLAPGLFSEIENEGGMASLSYLLDKPVAYQDAPDIFCLDLYKNFDIDLLETLAKPARVVESDSVR